MDISHTLQQTNNPFTHNRYFTYIP